MKKLLQTLGLLVSLCLFGSLSAQTQSVFYVSATTGSDTNDGLTWQTAFATAGKAAESIGLNTSDGKTYTIYMAEGTYAPSSSIQLTGDKTVRFVGGYPKPTDFTTATDTCNANPYVHPTVLDIKIKESIIRIGPQSGGAETKSTNVYFKNLTYDNPTVSGNTADGTFLTCTAYSNSATITMEYCIIKNYVSGGSAFFYVYSSDNHTFNFNNIYVTGGKADSLTGGSFFRTYKTSEADVCENITLNVKNCNFVGNETLNEEGGSLFQLEFTDASNGANITFENNGFCSNTHRGVGIGTLIRVEGATVTFENNSISNNTGRGNIYFEKSYLKSIKNNTFYNNNSNNMEGAAYHISGEHNLTNGERTTYTIDNDKFYRNTLTGALNDKGAAIYIKDANLEIKNSIFIENYENTSDGYGGAIYIKNGALTSTDNVYKSNEAGHSGGAIHMDGNHPFYSINDKFYDNKAGFHSTSLDRGGGAVYFTDNNNYIEFRGTEFLDNKSNHEGGAIKIDGNVGYADDLNTLVNCKFWGNTATNRATYDIFAYNAYIEGEINNNYMQHSQNIYPSSSGIWNGYTRFIFNNNNQFAVNPNLIVPTATIPNTATIDCTPLKSLVEPYVLATIGTDTTTLTDKTTICAKEIPDTKISFFSRTGVAPFTFEYRIDKITPNSTAIETGTTIHSATTTGTSNMTTLNIPNEPNMLNGVSYWYVVTKVTDSKGQVTDYGNCGGNHILTINVNPQPQLWVSEQPIEACPQTSITLNADFTATNTFTTALQDLGAQWSNSTNVVSWKWEKDGNVVANTQNHTINSINETAYGDYTVTVTDNNGCTNTKTLTLQQPTQDSDGDGICDSVDLDNDNDGIKDIDEGLHCDMGLSSEFGYLGANTYSETGTPSAFINQLLLFDWAGVSLNATNPTASKSITYNGVTYTANITNFRSSSPTGTLVGGGHTIPIYAHVAGYYNFTDLNKKPILSGSQFQGDGSYRDIEYDIEFTATKDGVSYPFEVVVADAQYTNYVNGVNYEEVRFQVNGNKFIKFEDLNRKAGVTKPNSMKIEGDGTNTIIYKDNRYSQSQSFVTGRAYTTKMHVSYGNLQDRVSDQAALFAIRVYCDYDRDGIPNFLDLDSDNDGCPDAKEGGADLEPTNTAYAQLSDGNGGVVNVNLTTTDVDANGIPNAVSPTGQTVGTSQNAIQNECQDTDGDGVPDYRDLDNDNDGILDKDECGTTELADWAISESSRTATLKDYKITVTRSNTRDGDNVIPANVDITTYTGYSGVNQLTGEEFGRLTGGKRGYNALYNIADTEFIYTFDRAIEEPMFFYMAGIDGYKNVTVTALDGSNANLGAKITKISNDGGLIGSDTFVYVKGTTINNGGFTATIPKGTKTYKVLVTAGTTGDSNFMTISTACADTDGDGIPNRLDLDSDGDGCPDAIEGSDNVTDSQLDSNDRIDIATQGGVDADGVPNLVNDGGTADTDNAQGQGVGSSQDSSTNDCNCGFIRSNRNVTRQLK